MTKGILAMTMTALLGGASAAYSEVHERIAAERGGRLEVDVSAGHVTVEGHEEDVVEIDATSTSDHYVFTLRQSGATVRLEGRREGWLPFGGGRVRVEVRVPIRFDVDVRTSGGDVEVVDVDGRVEVRSSGGRIRVEDVEGDLRLCTSGGPIHVHNAVGALELRSSGGTVELSEIQGPVDVRTSGGDIQVHDVAGRVDARTSGGPIRVRFDGAPAGELQTSGGAIDVAWPEQYGARIDAHTSGGKVRIDSCFDVSGHVERRRVRGDVGGGGEELKLRASGGHIRIQGT